VLSDLCATDAVACGVLAWADLSVHVARLYCGRVAPAAVGHGCCCKHYRPPPHQWSFYHCAGCQPEAVPGQWSYNIGPCRGIEFADQLWMSRFILHRLSEHFQLIASLDPKPVRF